MSQNAVSGDEAPSAVGRIEIDAPAAGVYALISDPGVLAELAEEYSSFRWLGSATRTAVGARFKGVNRNGVRRWSTTSTITDAIPGEHFAFDVSLGPVPISRWEYRITGTEQGCQVVEQTWERRKGWLLVLTSAATGVQDRVGHNQRSIEATLNRLKERAEAEVTA